MASTGWTNGNADGDLNTAANWTNGVPDAAKTPVYFDQTTGDSVTESMDALTAVLIPEVIVNPMHTGDVGTSGAPWEASFTLFTFRGTGRLFLKQGNTSDTADLILDAPSSNLMQIGCNTAQFDRIAALAGPVTLLSTLTGTGSLFVGANARVTIEGSNAITSVYVAPGGQILACNIPITTLHMLGGSMMQNREGGKITTVIMGGNARLDYQAATPPDLAIVGPGAQLMFAGDGRDKTLARAGIFEGGAIVESRALVVTAGGRLDGAPGLK